MSHSIKTAVQLSVFATPRWSGNIYRSASSCPVLLTDVCQVEEGIPADLTMLKVEAPDPGPLPLRVAVLAVQRVCHGVDRTADHSKKN